MDIRAFVAQLRSWIVPALCVAAGVAVRGFVVYHSLGSNDVVIWKAFANQITDHGLGWMYENQPIFNHPPLPGYYAELALAAEKRLGLRFEVAFKLPSLLAELLTAVLLYRIWRARGRAQAWRAVALFSLSLAGILISSHHGNTDALLAALLLLAARELDRERFLTAGLALGGAINVKLVPALLVPLFLLQCRTWRRAGLFVVPLALCAVPFVPFLLTHGPAFAQKALAYNSDPRRWGLFGLVDMLRDVHHLADAATGLTQAYRAAGRYAIIALIVALAVIARRRPRWSMIELATLGIVVFLALAPGFGVQYLEYAVPLVFALSLRRGVTYSTVGGLFLLVTYVDAWTGTHPWYSSFPGTYMAPLCVTLGILTWLVLLATGRDVLLAGWRRALSQPAPMSGST